MNIKKLTLSLLSLSFLLGTVNATEFRYEALYAGTVNVMGTSMDLPDFTKWHYFAFDERNNNVTVQGTSDFELENITPGNTGTEKINTDWQVRTDWDIAFHAYDIRTNSGIAGNGNAGAIFIADKASAIVAGKSLDAIYTDLTEAPAVAYPADQTISGNFYLSLLGMPPTRATSLSVASATRKAADGTTGASVDFSSLAMGNSGAIENPMIVVFKTASGKYVKVYLKQFIEENKSGILVFDYEFIPLTSTSIANVGTASFAVYPNLVSDELNINLSLETNIEIYSLHGITVKQLKNQTGEISIPVYNWAKGVYLVKTTSGKANKIQKIIIK
jgi:hypothetical protein